MINRSEHTMTVYLPSHANHTAFINVTTLSWRHTRNSGGLQSIYPYPFLMWAIIKVVSLETSLWPRWRDFIWISVVIELLHFKSTLRKKK